LEFGVDAHGGMVFGKKGYFVTRRALPRREAEARALRK
jgi:hypothetical protein